MFTEFVKQYTVNIIQRVLIAEVQYTPNNASITKQANFISASSLRKMEKERRKMEKEVKRQQKLAKQMIRVSLRLLKSF